MRALALLIGLSAPALAAPQLKTSSPPLPAPTEVAEASQRVVIGVVKSAWRHDGETPESHGRVVVEETLRGEHSSTLVISWASADWTGHSTVAPGRYVGERALLFLDAQDQVLDAWVIEETRAYRMWNSSPSSYQVMLPIATLRSAATP